MYGAKKITSIKVYNNIMNSINLLGKMNPAFVNSENSKTSNPRRLKGVTNMLLYQILGYIIHKKVQKTCTKPINLKYQLWRGMKNLNYLMDHILFQILRNYFGYVIEKHDTLTENPPIRIYINKIENRTTFKIKTGYYLEFLMPEMIKVLRTIKIR